MDYINIPQNFFFGEFQSDIAIAIGFMLLIARVLVSGEECAIRIEGLQKSAQSPMHYLR